MAKIIEPLDNQQQELTLEQNDQFVNLDEQQQQGQAPSSDTDNGQQTIPDKYQGKSIDEVVQMHQEAEKLLGRQSSEVGELRKVVDDFIRIKADEIKQQSPQTQQESEVDFFENPKEAVTNAIANSDEVKQMKDLLAQQQQQSIMSQLNEKHPDYTDIVKDAEFVDWLQKSPVRMELLKRADAYDFSAADELLSTWKQLQGVRDVSKQDRKQQIKAASTGGKGSGEPVTRKIYRRSDIVNLMIKDPERYKANVEEFDKAYREGRVK